MAAWHTYFQLIVYVFTFGKRMTNIEQYIGSWFPVFAKEWKLDWSRGSWKYHENVVVSDRTPSTNLLSMWKQENILKTCNRHLTVAKWLKRDMYFPFNIGLTLYRIILWKRTFINWHVHACDSLNPQHLGLTHTENCCPWASEGSPLPSQTLREYEQKAQNHSIVRSW